MNDSRYDSGHSEQAGTPSPEAVRTRFALRVTAHLTEHSKAIAPDLTERLRFAREAALELVRVARAGETAIGLGATRGGAGVSCRNGAGWWAKLASVVPAIALAAGLFLIQSWQDNTQISIAAEVDAALLSDTVPPRAYSDAGFAEFLKTPGE